jgi:hypothetical protein
MEDDLRKKLNGRRPQKKLRNGKQPQKNGKQPQKMMNDFCLLDISSSWVKRSLHAKFQLPSLPGSGSFMVGDTKKKKTKLGRIRGFLSPS